MKKILKLSENNTNVDNDSIHQKLKAHKIGDLSLTITTIIFVILCLCFN